MNNAFIFPGQGSQYIGMGHDLYLAYPVAREVFESIDHSLNFKLSEMIFCGEQEELTQTVNAQLAITAVSLAFMQTILTTLKKDFSGICQVTAGHSLGEYNALNCSGVLSMTDTINLLKIRSQAMHSATLARKGSMAAIIGVDSRQLEDYLIKLNSNQTCEIANDNSNEQIIISGEELVINGVITALKDQGIKAIKLNVSGAFHSRLMQPAEDKMTTALDSIVLNKPKVGVIQNYTAKISENSAEIKQNLIKQICGRVRWRETLMEFEQLGVQNIIEVGPGKVLTNMIRKSYGEKFNTRNINNIQSLDEYFNSL